MKLLKFSLRGAIGIWKGLGVDEMEIDFQSLQSGLVALTGRNGSGKTTVIENLHPYRTLVSRSGSLQSHFRLKDSHKFLSFEYDGAVYESRILIDALTGKSEAYLVKDGKPVNDGKSTTYDEAIEALLGTPELFFNSVFSGQKSTGIAELKPADRRKLFYELLNLNHYESLLEIAKGNLSVVQNKLAKIEGEISALNATADSIDSLEAEKNNLIDEKISLETQLSDLETEKTKVEAEIKDLEVKIRVAESKLEESKKIQAEIADVESKIKSLADDNNAKVKPLNQQLSGLKSQLTYQSSLIDKHTINEVKRGLARRKELTAEIDLLSANLEIAQSNLEAANFSKNISLDVLTVKKGKIKEIENEIKSLEIGLVSLRDALNDCKRNAELIDNVPCDDVTGKNCQFVKNAYINKSQIGERESGIEKQQTKITELKAILDEWNTDLVLLEKAYNEDCAQYDITFDERRALNEKIQILRREATSIDAKNYEQLKSEADKAENEIALVKEKISSAEKLIAEAKESFDKANGEYIARIGELNKKLMTADGAAEIANMRERLFEKENDLDSRLLHIQSMRNQIQNNDKQITELDTQLKTAIANAANVTKLQYEKQHFEQEIKDWTFLTKAFDKTGIPVLKLENSGVQITALANELLSMFENKFRIVFETTTLKADKKSLKETFNINIVENDGVCEISNKSGGQQVWLETAIQLAITLVVRQQGRKIQTSFLDEKDGALDLDNAMSYIQMIQRAHVMSGVHNTFIITHRTELLDYIPQQIIFRNGRVEIEQAA